MLLYILEENIFFINHCGVATCGQTDQEPVKLSKVSKVSKIKDTQSGVLPIKYQNLGH